MVLMQPQTSMMDGQHPFGLVGFQTDFVPMDHFQGDGVALLVQVLSSGSSTDEDLDEPNGVMLVTTGANGRSHYGLAGRPFRLDYGKKLWCGIRFHLDDIDGMNWWSGLQPSGNSNQILIPSTHMCGFICDETDGTIDAITRTASTTTRTEIEDAKFTVDGEWVELAMHWDGQGRLKYFVNGKFVQLHMANVPLNQNMTWVVEFQSVAIESASVDFCYCWKER